MTDLKGYAVYFFPQALEALGEAIKPYLQDGPSGMHVVCREIDTSGSLIEMTLDGTSSGAPEAEGGVAELMVPTAMVRMIVSIRNAELFGFGVRPTETATPGLPPVGPTGQPADAPATVAGATVGAAPAGSKPPVEDNL